LTILNKAKTNMENVSIVLPVRWFLCRYLVRSRISPLVVQFLGPLAPFLICPTKRPLTLNKYIIQGEKTQR
jgi:hypothetical protein